MNWTDFADLTFHRLTLSWKFHRNPVQNYLCYFTIRTNRQFRFISAPKGPAWPRSRSFVPIALAWLVTRKSCKNIKLWLFREHYETRHTRNSFKPISPNLSKDCSSNKNTLSMSHTKIVVESILNHCGLHKYLHDHVIEFHQIQVQNLRLQISMHFTSSV